MSDHISFFLNLKHYITEAGLKLDDILVVYAILYFLPCSNIWDIVKQNLLDKEKVLTCKGTSYACLDHMVGFT